MPLYEFECLDCKTTFEKIVKTADAIDDVTCRQCGSINIRKIISAGSHRLGSGTPLPAAGAGPACPTGSRFR